MSDAPQRIGRTTLVVLACVVALALALRLPTLGRLLPHWPEPDPFLVLKMQDLRGDAALRLNIDFAERYPTLLPRAVAGWPHELAPRDASEAEHLAAASQPYVQMRAAVLLLAILAVPLVFAIARRFTCDRDALFGAFFAATSLLHVAFSTQARPHAAAVALALLAVWLAIRWLESPGFARAACATVAAAVSMATFQSGAFALPPLVVAFALGPGTKLRRALHVAAALIVVAALALPFYPFRPRIDASGVHLAGDKGHEIPLSDLTGEGLLRAARWLLEYDPVLLVLPLLGICAAFVRDRGWLRDRRVLVAAAHAVPYALVVALNRELYERFVLPLVPWLALFAGIGVGALLDLARRHAPARVLLHGLALVALAAPLVVAARFVQVATAPDVFQLAARWLRENAALGETIFVQPGIGLPVLATPEALATYGGERGADSQAWTRYQSVVGVDAPSPRGLDVRFLPLSLLRAKPGEAHGIVAGTIDAARTRWIVVERTGKAQYFHGLAAIREVASARGDLVWEADVPEAARADELRIDYQDAHDVLRRLFAQPRLGTHVEIWRLRDP